MKRLFIFLCLLAMNGILFAQGAAEASSKMRVLDTVSVFGKGKPNHRSVNIGKIDIPAFDLPQSIAIIDEKLLADQQALRLSDAIKNVNGMYLGTTRGSTQETFYARGYNLGGNNIFKNGARINAGSIPEISSLEQVEILKGSAAILYGNVAPGGVINMITKKPKFDFGGKISLLVGSYDRYKPMIDVYGPISKRIAFRLNGTYASNKSFRKEVSAERYYVNPSLLFKVGKKTDVVLEGDYLYNRFTTDFGLGTVGNKIVSFDRSSFFGANWQYAITQQSTLSLSLTHAINSAWKIYGIASYQSYSRDYFSTERIQASENGEWKRPLNKQLSREDYYSIQANVNGKFNTGQGISHNILAGVDADRISSFTTNYNNPKTYDTINLFDLQKYRQRTDIPATRAKNRINTPVNRVGIYVQDLISLGGHLKALLGVRWSLQQSEPSVNRNLEKPKDSSYGGQIDYAFSPRFGIVYQPIKTIAIFASYANSFVINSGSDIYFKALPPSLIDQFELGIKRDMWDGLLSVNLTGYMIINSNFAQMAQFDAQGAPNSNKSIKELAGQTKSYGVELDIVGHPIKGLDITAGYSFNDMRYTKTSGAPTAYIEGERLVNTPAHTINASAFYTFSATAVKGLKLGISVNYIGERNAGWNNTHARPNLLLPVSGFATADISIGYSFKHISILGKVSNLWNEYNFYVHENYSVNPILPRQFTFTVAYMF